MLIRRFAIAIAIGSMLSGCFTALGMTFGAVVDHGSKDEPVAAQRLQALPPDAYYFAQPRPRRIAPRKEKQGLSGFALGGTIGLAFDTAVILMIAITANGLYGDDCQGC